MFWISHTLPRSANVFRPSHLSVTVKANAQARRASESLDQLQIVLFDLHPGRLLSSFSGLQAQLLPQKHVLLETGYLRPQKMSCRGDQRHMETKKHALPELLAQGPGKWEHDKVE